MPTGYTAGVADGEDGAVEYLERYAGNYAWRRHVSSWQEALDYAIERLDKALTELRLYEGGGLGEEYGFETAGVWLNREYDKYAREMRRVDNEILAREAATRRNYDSVIATLQSIEAPNEGMRTFLEQAIEHLQESRDFDVTAYNPRKVLNKDEWLENKKAQLDRTIRYAREDIEKYRANIEVAYKRRAEFDQLLLRVRLQQEVS